MRADSRQPTADSRQPTHATLRRHARKRFHYQMGDQQIAGVEDGTRAATMKTPIVLYTQDGCAQSGQLRHWLNHNGLTFTERNVTGSTDDLEELAATGILATPLLKIGDELVFGFRPRVIHERLLALSQQRASNSTM